MCRRCSGPELGSGLGDTEPDGIGGEGIYRAELWYGLGDMEPDILIGEGNGLLTEETGNPIFVASNVGEGDGYNSDPTGDSDSGVIGRDDKSDSAGRGDKDLGRIAEWESMLSREELPKLTGKELLGSMPFSSSSSEKITSTKSKKSVKFNK